MAQQEIFYATLAERLIQLGYDVKMFTEYQFRINGRLDVYPVNRRWHDIKENRRGDYEDIFDFCENFFKRNNTMPVMILDLKKEMKDMPKNTPFIRRYERLRMEAMILSEGEASQITPTVSAKILNYPIYFSRDKGGREVHYAIQEADKEILDHLLLLRKDELLMEKTEAINEALTEQHILATRQAQENMWAKIQEIKNLPWWKRLLNQF